MPRLSSFLLFFVLVTSLYSCSEDQRSCEFPSLDKVHNQNVYYHNNGLIAQFNSFFSLNTIQYRETGQVSTINITSNHSRLFNKVSFFYDGNDRLSHVIRFTDELVYDSIQLTHDGQDRIIMLTFHAYNPSADPAYHLHQTIEYEYTGMNSTHSRLYRPTGEERLMDIEFDNHPRPLPLEMWLMDFSSTPYFFGQNNPTKITYNYKDPRYIPENRVIIQNFTYQYNSAGYPVKIKVDGVTTSYSYSCDQRSVTDL